MIADHSPGGAIHDVRREGAPDFGRGVNRARPDTFMFYHCLTLVA
jgi:hypothetical protein